MDTPALPPMAAPPQQALPVAPVPISVALHVQRIYLNFLGKGKGDNVLPSVPSTELFNDACRVTQAYINGTLVAVDPTHNPCKDVAGEVQLLPRGTVGGVPMPQPGFSPGNPQPKRDMWGNRGGQPGVAMVNQAWLERYGTQHGLANNTTDGSWVARYGTHCVFATSAGTIRLHRSGGYTINWVDHGATVEQLLACLTAASKCAEPQPPVPAVSGATG